MRFSFGVHAPPSVVQGKQACIPILKWWSVLPDFHRLVPCSFDELYTILTLLFARCFLERGVDLTEVPGCSPQPRVPPGQVLSHLFLGWYFSPLPQGPDLFLPRASSTGYMGTHCRYSAGSFSSAASPSRESGVSWPLRSQAPQSSRLPQTM